MNKLVILTLIMCFIALRTHADESEVRAKILADVQLGKPLIAHVTVALCDNDSQGIVSVSNGLCVGDSPRTNLYWGAMYGLKTFFSRHKKWQRIDSAKPANSNILERVIFERMINVDGVSTSVFLVADAWTGIAIKDSVEHFLKLSSGMHSEVIKINDKHDAKVISAGGNSHVVAYIGHNGLMDFSVPNLSVNKAGGESIAAIILACYSKNYFESLLANTDAYPLLTTTGLMAPEAYTLEAALTSWFTDGSPEKTHAEASAAYAKYQKANLKWSKRLFSTGSRK